MLTGKAKKDFEKWLQKEELRSDTLETLSIPNQHFYIIKWLDLLRYKGNKFYSHVFEKSYSIRIDNMSIFDIHRQAIDVCNTYYNRIKNNVN